MPTNNAKAFSVPASALDTSGSNLYSLSKIPDTLSPQQCYNVPSTGGMVSCSPTTPLPVYLNTPSGGNLHGTLPKIPGLMVHQTHQRVMMMKNVQDSPSSFTTSIQDSKKPGRRHSLLGFDPLLNDTSVGPATMNLNHMFSINAVTPSQPVTPDTNSESRNENHRREMQPYRPDERVLNQKTTTEESQQHSPHKQEQKPFTDMRETWSPRTPCKSVIENKSSNQLPSPRCQIGGSRRDIFTISISSKKFSSKNASTNLKDTADVESDLGKPKRELKSGGCVALKLPWQKMKGHHRTQSLETPADLSKNVSERQSQNASFHDTSETSQQNASNNSSNIRQELMELSFDMLQLPTLAKPSPTSFLTGHVNEVMRTCEYEAAPFQLEIPSLSEFLVSARLNEFVENYRRIDQNFDLQQWKGMSNQDLQKVREAEHIPIAQLLLDCGEDVSIEGFIGVGSSADDRVEAVIFEGQQHFVVVIRGTTEQQSKPFAKKTTNRKAVPIDTEREHVEVYQCFLDEYLKIEKACFAELDKLTEEHPFCDVTFTGYSFGAALSTLAALRYSNARPMMRVNNYPMASPKVGFSEFRRMVNSSPNLRVMRLELGQDGKCQLPGQGGSHVGHTLVLNTLGSNISNNVKTSDLLLAYKFTSPKLKKFKTTHPDLRSYVVSLEEFSRLKLSWAKDFVGTSGDGVVVNNEARQMV